MIKRKYPRYTREESNACKLTDENIKEIQVNYEKGKTILELSKIFNVTGFAIRYWVKPEFRKRMLEYCKKWRKENPPSKENALIRNKKFKIRKKNISKNYKLFLAITNKIWKKKNKEKSKISYQKWYLKFGKKYYGIKRNYKKYQAVTSPTNKQNGE